MMKFFRKYNKFILLGMAALMVLFLVPALFQQEGARGNPEMGVIRADGESRAVRQGDLLPSRTQLAILEQAPQAVFGGVARYVGLPATGARYNLRDHAETWFLWGVLIDRYQITVSDAERDAYYKSLWKTDLAISAERKKLAGEVKVTVGMVDQAFDRLIALNKLTDVMAESVINIPEYDVRHAIRDLSERVMVDLVYPNTPALLTLVAEPDEQRLAEQFDRYKDRLAGEGPFQFGYRIPAQAAVELMVVDAAEVAGRPELLGDVNEARKAAFRYWQEHPDEFEVAPAPTTQPADEAASQPAAPAAPATQAEKKVRPFAEVSAQIMRKLARPPGAGVGAPADAFARSVLDYALAEEAKARAANPKQPLPFGSLEPGAAPADTLADRVRSARKFAPTVLRSRLFARDEADSLSGPLAELVRGGRAMGQGRSLLDVVFTAAPFAPAADVNAGPLPVQLNEGPREIYQAGDDKYFIWRLVEAVPSHVPADLAAVRDKVVADVREQLVYELARERIGAVLESAESGVELREAVKAANAELAASRVATTQPADAEPTTQPDREYLVYDFRAWPRREIGWTAQDSQLVEQFRKMGVPWQRLVAYGLIPPLRLRTPMTPVGRVGAVVDKAFELAEQAGDDADAATSAATQPDSARPMAVVDLPELGLVVLEKFQTRLDATTRDYRDLRPQVLEVLAYEASQSFVNSWYNPRELRKRVGFEPTARQREAEEE